MANSGLHAFLEFHSVDEATEALCLDGILFMDRALQVRHLLCCRGMYPTHLVRLPIISSASPPQDKLGSVHDSGQVQRPQRGDMTSRMREIYGDGDWPKPGDANYNAHLHAM